MNDVSVEIKHMKEKIPQKNYRAREELAMIVNISYNPY